MSFEERCASCYKRQEEVLQLFSAAATQEEKYQVLLKMGKEQAHIDPSEKTPDRLVEGCQSQMYVSFRVQNDCLFFQTEADALISAGLGELIRRVYSGEPFDVILGCPLRIIDQLGLRKELSPSRVNGLSSLLMKIKKEALHAFKQREGLI